MPKNQLFAKPVDFEALANEGQILKQQIERLKEIGQFDRANELNKRLGEIKQQLATENKIEGLKSKSNALKERGQLTEAAKLDKQIDELEIQVPLRDRLLESQKTAADVVNTEDAIKLTQQDRKNPFRAALMKEKYDDPLVEKFINKYEPAFRESALQQSALNNYIREQATQRYSGLSNKNLLEEAANNAQLDKSIVSDYKTLYQDLNKMIDASKKLTAFKNKGVVGSRKINPYYSKSDYVMSLIDKFSSNYKKPEFNATFRKVLAERKGLSSEADIDKEMKVLFDKLSDLQTFQKSYQKVRKDRINADIEDLKTNQFSNLQRQNNILFNPQKEHYQLLDKVRKEQDPVGDRRLARQLLKEPSSADSVIKNRADVKKTGSNYYAQVDGWMKSLENNTNIEAESREFMRQKLTDIINKKGGSIKNVDNEELAKELLGSFDNTQAKAIGQDLNQIIKARPKGTSDSVPAKSLWGHLWRFPVKPYPHSPHWVDRFITHLHHGARNPYRISRLDGLKEPKRVGDRYIEQPVVIPGYRPYADRLTFERDMSFRDIPRQLNRMAIMGNRDPVLDFVAEPAINMFLDERIDFNNNETPKGTLRNF